MYVPFGSTAEWFIDDLFGRTALKVGIAHRPGLIYFDPVLSNGSQAAFYIAPQAAEAHLLETLDQSISALHSIGLSPTTFQ